MMEGHGRMGIWARATTDCSQVGCAAGLPYYPSEITIYGKQLSHHRKRGVSPGQGPCGLRSNTSKADKHG